MLFPHLKERLRKDGWLYLALVGCILLCLILGMTEGSSTQTAEEARLARVLSAMAGAGDVEVAEIRMACHTLSPFATAIAPKPKLTEKYPTQTGKPIRIPAQKSFNFNGFISFRGKLVYHTTGMRKSQFPQRAESPGIACIFLCPVLEWSHKLGHYCHGVEV